MEEVCREYLRRGGHAISRAQFEANLGTKVANEDFRTDLLALVRDDIDYDLDEAMRLVSTELIDRL